MLAPRDGVGASQVSLPAGPWTSMLDFLVERFPGVSADDWVARMRSGDVVDAAGRAVAPRQAYVPHGKLYYYRTVPHEAPNAAQADILFEDELLVVADKPHFLPVTPSGPYLQETLLVRLRRALAAPALTPIHRIDRETAGVVLFAKHPSICAGYQALFAARKVAKVYEAIAPATTRYAFPLTRSNTLVEGDHFMTMREADPAEGLEPNAHTGIECVEARGAWARYRLRPASGKRHQLRVHMAALGLPILGDRIYPNLLPVGTDDTSNPLRLLAQSIAFRDPVTGGERFLCSARQLRFPGEA
ncbi:pseudouridine synthase [Caenimonas aquaedulcis]|uniref:Pseudouridine synthase n=1 Tax=Caenimonas aquaedulcis TaxID=2793270 RepID=A0A931H969_9BURK|nr:pseudouridine synthase [Caenimonas aquaedulcis]MBG9390653.1 pseudouridine synthase [Caenimonas aquaedulcis]